MATKATAREEAILDGEEVLREDEVIRQSELVSAKVIYRGGNQHKTVRMRGTVSVSTLRDSEDGHVIDEVKTPSAEGWTMYDFASVDSRGRRLPDELFIDGRRFQIVEHPGHLVELFGMKDTDKQPMFEIRGSAATIDRLKRFVALLRRHRDPDRGVDVLRAMGLT